MNEYNKNNPNLYKREEIKLKNVVNKKNSKNNSFNKLNGSNMEKENLEKLIYNFRLDLNKELLRKLFEEREKENIREKLLLNAKDLKERKKMEQRFIYERAQASSEIIVINE